MAVGSMHKDTRELAGFRDSRGDSSVQQRLIASYVSDLAKLGIAARLRVVDSSQYQSRLKDYDYDMIQTAWPSSLSPGNEQVFRWDSRNGRRAGVVQLRRREEPGRRCDDQPVARGRGGRRLYIRRAGARPACSSPDTM